MSILRRSLTVAAVLLALLLGAASGVFEPVTEWAGRHLHKPHTHYQETVPVTWVNTASAARKGPDRTSITSMARYYHCNIVATPGPDWFRGKIVRGWIVGVEGKGYFHAHPSFWGWEPRGHDFIKAVCQF